MGVSPARAAAFDILTRVERHGAYASELLHAEPAARLSGADHGLATELVMGVLRWRSRLDEVVAQHSSAKIEKLDGEVLTALRLAAYQIQFLDRIPARAAIHESVELVKRARKRSAAPFVNAVARKIASGSHSFAISAHQQGTQGGASFKTAAELAAEYSHPAWLVQRWTEAYGMQIAQRICSYDQHRPHTAIRLRDAAAEQELREAGIELAPGELLASARRVLAGNIAGTHAIREGKVAIQDEASQLVALLVGAGQRILDCCAAPGGKTSILGQENPGAEVVAVEVHPHRARLLRDLLHSPKVRVVCADARSLPLRAGFDRILADVPCSGTGTLARNPDIKWRLQPGDLEDLQRRQLAILRAALQSLAAQGRIVYSTGSLEKEENSDVVETILAETPSVRRLDCNHELDRLQRDGELIGKQLASMVSGPYLRTIPGVHACDGFFAAILEKN